MMTYRSSSRLPYYKLYYVNARGFAEGTRLLFAYKGISYEDIRRSGEWWRVHKPGKIPYGGIPALVEDRKMLSGSFTTILRYLAEKEEFNLAGSNAWENAQLASIGEFIKDFFSEMVKIYYEKDETKKEEIQKRFSEEVIPEYFGKLNELSSDSGYLFNNRLSWPDLLLHPILEHHINLNADILKSYPGLDKLYKNVSSEPGIAKWIDVRPKTEY